MARSQEISGARILFELSNSAIVGQSDRGILESRRSGKAAFRAGIPRCDSRSSQTDGRASAAEAAFSRKRRTHSKRRIVSVKSARLAFKNIERGLSHPKVRLTTTREISLRMGNIRQSGTDPELRVRRAATAVGLRYRLDNRDLPGSPDLANRRQKWAVFVHGCFWHRHSGCRKATTPKSNRDFWTAKFARNQTRDQRVATELQSLGFSVVVVWECETGSPSQLIDRLRVLAHRSKRMEH